MGDSLVQSVRSQVSGRLDISTARVRLVLGTTVLSAFDTVEASGVCDGARLLVIVLPPIYGHLVEMGVSPPDDIMSLKAELHSELATTAAGPRRRSRARCARFREGGDRLWS